MPVTVMLPVLVRAKVWAGQVNTLQPGFAVGLQLAGVRAALSTPVPLSATGEPMTGTLAVMASVPVAAPAAVGRNTTLMVQVVPAARVVPQVPPAAPAGRAKGPVNAKVMPVAVVPPVFLSVRVCAERLVPNASDVGDTLRTATPLVWNSTAPTSIAPAISGLGLPKKSLVGAIA